MAKFQLMVTFSAFAVLTALSQNEVINIEPAVGQLLLKEGQAQELKCSAKVADTTARLIWDSPTKTGVTEVEMNTSGNRTTLYKTLQISEFTPAHSGVYKCKLSTNESISKEISLVIVAETKSEGRFVKDSPNVTLSCGINVDTSSIRNVKWRKVEKKDGATVLVPLSEIKGFSFYEEWDNKTSLGSLTISNPKIDNAGLYAAIFEMGESSYTCDVQFQAGPVVQDLPKSKNIIQGEKMDLKCIVKGYPPPTVSWLKNNESLNVTSTLSSSMSEQTAQLLVESADFVHSGDYTCRAVSVVLNETSMHTLTVKVKDKLAALWPFLGIVAEVIVLCTIIFIYEKRRNRQVQLEEKAAEEVDGSATDKKEGLRHRNTNNPTA